MSYQRSSVYNHRVLRVAAAWTMGYRLGATVSATVTINESRHGREQ